MLACALISLLRIQRGVDLAEAAITQFYSAIFNNLYSKYMYKFNRNFEHNSGLNFPCAHKEARK